MTEDSVKYTAEYRAILNYYGDGCAQRSGVPLMAHIDEGLDILELLGASRDAMRAWCLHPLFQSDDDLLAISENDIVFSFSPRCVMLAMEYRARANDWLSDKVSRFGRTMRDGVDVPHLSQSGKPSAGVLLEVRDMLVADKIQNYKDFLAYHYGKHERSEELNHYFLEWFKVLAVDQAEYIFLTKLFSKEAAHKAFGHLGKDE